MTIAGIILLVAGIAGCVLLALNLVPAMSPLLLKMPLGMKGWAIVAVVGIVLMILNRRTAD